MSENIRSADITATPECRKMRQAYPDLPDEQVRQLAQQAITLEQQNRPAPASRVRSNTFEDELHDKLVATVAELIVKYSYDIWGKTIIIHVPKIEIPYKTVAELADYITTSVEKSPPPQPVYPAYQAPYAAVTSPPSPAPLNPPAPAPVAPPAGTEHGLGARVLFRILKWALGFIGGYMIFYAVYDLFYWGEITSLLWIPVGIFVLWLIRFIPNR